MRDSLCFETSETRQSWVAKGSGKGIRHLDLCFLAIRLRL